MASFTADGGSNSGWKGMTVIRSDRISSGRDLVASFQAAGQDRIALSTASCTEGPRLITTEFIMLAKSSSLAFRRGCSGRLEAVCSKNAVVLDRSDCEDNRE